MKLLKSSLVRLFGASSIGLGLTGCVTPPMSPPGECMDVVKTALFYSSKFNKDCALGKVAETFSQSSDEGEKVLGQYLKEKLDPAVKQQADRVRDEAVEKTAPYKVKGYEVKNGRKVFILAPRPAEQAASEPAAASAPAP